MEEKLIESVRKYGCLWQVKSREYKDLRLKENSWKEVSEETGLPAADCQKVWKRLRDKFVREEKKTKSMRSGDSGPLYSSLWEYFEVLSFLLDTIKHRQTVTNFSAPLDDGCVHDDDEEDNDDDSESIVAVDQFEHKQSMTTRQSTPSPSVPLSGGVVQTPMGEIRSNRGKGKKRKVDAEAVDLAMLQLINDQKSNPTEPSLDEEGLFGLHIAAKLRQLSDREKAIAEIKIEEILLEAKFGYQYQQSSHQYQH
ncbi:transcription factor Adf-1-like [Corticium candelabrum]|uniref:transcription factor Adf-1-like n=1 Tax=Corticium candelabrum TaxID=121492 RepID=UPI002E26F922|nr:transcription factor Adf-1-like [Corticium candelabrum]